MTSALLEWADGKRHGIASKPDEVRTLVHELTHYHQLTTTPYGLFLHYCKLLQSHSVIELADTLLSAGYSLTPPLLYNLPSDPPGKVAEHVERCVGAWLNIEELVAVLDGNTDRRVALNDTYIAVMDLAKESGRPMLPPLLGVERTFALVQSWMADHIRQANEHAVQSGSPKPVYADNIDWPSISAELTARPADRERALERLEFSMSIIGNPWEVDAIAESHATAAEFWGSDATYESFTAWVHGRDRGLEVYRAGLAAGLTSIATTSLPSFLASYMTLCESALFAPLLPQHAALRARSPGFDQLAPTLRFANLLFAAARVRPMQSIRDHDRYVRDLYKDLGWVHPASIMRSAIDGPQEVTDAVTFIYLQAQRWRAQKSPTSFIGIDRLIYLDSPMAEQWRTSFNFTIIDYKDRTTYHRDKDLLEIMTTRYLNMLGLEALMRHDSLTLEAPYGASAAENEWMTNWLRARFRFLFGRSFADLRVVPRSNPSLFTD